MSGPAKIPSAGLLAACDDPRLFNVKLWPKQRDALSPVEEQGKRIHVWKFGRRSGKSFMIALAGLHSCLLRPELRRYLRPGERGYAVVVATNLRQARLVVSAARSIVEASPLLKGMVESATDDEILFKNGTAFTAFPCTSRGGRGWPIFFLGEDEAAHMLDTEGSSAAERVHEALMPSTAQFGTDARVVVSSTPYGTDGLFAQLYQQAASGELGDAVALSATSAEMNPTLTEEFLEAEEARDPDSFRGEYLAEFVGSGAAFLDPDSVREAVEDRAELLPSDGEGWIVGLDPAFARDATAVAVVGRDRRDSSRLLLAHAERWLPPKVKLLRKKSDVEKFMKSTLDAVAALAKRYNAPVVTDQHLGGVITDELERRGVQTVTVAAWTAANRTEAFRELNARLRMGRLGLYDEPTLVAELFRLRTKYRAGSATVVTPRTGDSHCDMAVALALAVHQHGQGAPAFTLTDAHMVPDVEPGGWWGRLESFAVAGARACWVRWGVDDLGNLVALDMVQASSLASEIAPLVSARGGGKITAYSSPELFGGQSPDQWRKWGAPHVLADEFVDAGMRLIHGNGDVAAGRVRLAELLRVDHGRLFPSWHPRAGELGSPRLFVGERCRELVEQLRGVPLEDEQLDEKWEERFGPAVAATRFAAMTRPSPSKEPVYMETVDPGLERQAWLKQHFERREKSQRRESRYERV